MELFRNIFLPRDAMRKCGLCHRAVSVSPSVTVFKIFQPSGSHAMLFFSVGNVMAIFRLFVCLSVAKIRDRA